MKHITKPLMGTQLDWSNNLNKGLAGFWLMNEGGGDKIQDLSMNGNKGTLVGMAHPPTPASGWNPGRKGVGLNFDGGNDYVDAGNAASLNITNAITIEAWVKTTTITAQRNIIMKGGGTATNYGIDIGSIAGKLRFFGYASGVAKGIILAGGTVIDDGIWHHIAGTFDGTNWIIYRDGVVDNSKVDAATLTPTTETLQIGARQSTGYFDGSIDEVRIYNRALSASEIMELYINPYGMFLK